MKVFYLYLIVLLIAINSAKAEDMMLDSSSLDDSVTAVYGVACENIRDDEALSSARVRVTDKASFIAIQEIEELSSFKKEINDHDFNVLVYNIVDNYLEDMAVRTTSKDNQKICVEVTGYIQEKNIIKSINETLQKVSAPDEEQEFESNPNLEDIIVDATEKSKERIPDARDFASKIYFAPTEFFDKSKSEAYKPILQKYFSSLGLDYVEDTSVATYIITPKILRAKVDPINKDTSRLQMVISLELKITEEDDTHTSHQNRFVLFTNETGEQNAARSLLEKLFAKAAEEIVEKISQLEQKNKSTLPAVITPVKN